MIQEYATVIDTLSIDFLENEKKLIKLSNGDEWLHGIGSKRHPFRAIAENDINRYNVCHVHFSFESYSYPIGTGYCIGISSEYELNNINFKVFPNPIIDNRVFLQTEQDLFIKQVFLYDISGRLTYSSNIYRRENNVNITLPNLPNGMYIIQIDTEKGLINKKINVLK